MLTRRYISSRSSWADGSAKTTSAGSRPAIAPAHRCAWPSPTRLTGICAAGGLPACTAATQALSVAASRSSKMPNIGPPNLIESRNRQLPLRRALRCGDSRSCRRKAATSRPGSANISVSSRPPTRTGPCWRPAYGACLDTIAATRASRDRPLCHCGELGQHRHVLGLQPLDEPHRREQAPPLRGPVGRSAGEREVLGHDLPHGRLGQRRGGAAELVVHPDRVERVVHTDHLGQEAGRQPGQGDVEAGVQRGQRPRVRAAQEAVGADLGQEHAVVLEHAPALVVRGARDVAPTLEHDVVAQQVVHDDRWLGGRLRDDVQPTPTAQADRRPLHEHIRPHVRFEAAQRLHLAGESVADVANLGGDAVRRRSPPGPTWCRRPVRNAWITRRATRRPTCDSWSRTRWWKIASGPPDTTAAARARVSELNSKVLSGDEVSRSGSSNPRTGASAPAVTATRGPSSAARRSAAPGCSMRAGSGGRRGRDRPYRGRPG